MVTTETLVCQFRELMRECNRVRDTLIAHDYEGWASGNAELSPYLIEVSRATIQAERELQARGAFDFFAIMASA